MTQPPSGNLRLFYAVRLPPELTTTLTQAQRELRGNWRPVKPEQMHITLAFMPHVPASALSALRDLNRSVARAVSAFSARLGGTGYFPNAGSPRVWFAKVEAPELTALAEHLRAGLTDLGVAFEELPFKPHITLARRKGPAPRLGPASFDLTWEVRGVTLIQSRLYKTGPVYEQLAHHYLWREQPAEPAEPLAPRRQ